MIDLTLKNANILIVDDQQTNIDILTGLLDVEGFKNYVTTTNSRKVGNLFEEFNPDILLLDLMMPYFDGFQVLKQVKNFIPSNTFLPIIILTADISIESRQKALLGGASDFLTKPLDLIEVNLRINNLLKIRYLQQQLEIQNQTLEEKVRKRTLELENINIDLIIAKEKAEGMNQLKNNFLANMSHELRTPLFGIIGYSEVILEDSIDKNIKEKAEIIYKSGIRLSETLNLILDLSKLESEKMEFSYEKINLVHETKEVISIWDEVVQKKGLNINSSFCQPAIFLNIDKRTFRSIINNLIKNAIKYTKEGSITVEINLYNNFVEIKVIDTGIGISKKHYKIIFEEFRQVSEGIGRNFEGTGLGLNITNKLVLKFGGEIFLESEIGKGSTFTVKLPIIIKEEPLIENTQLNYLIEQIPSKPIALLVDDDPNVYPILKRYLGDKFTLENIYDGELAVKLCSQQKFDLIFMDINLCFGIDGEQATRLIRKIPGYETIPIIASTAYAMVGDKEKLLSAGCSHYLSKPFTKQDILELLGKIIKN